ncbi:MAG: hypothetical protein KC619_12800 [Myxococcales bacterium]|nr:hypothetical protein [Myxococcales bacterium]
MHLPRPLVILLALLGLACRGPVGRDAGGAADGGSAEPPDGGAPDRDGGPLLDAATGVALPTIAEALGDCDGLATDPGPSPNQLRAATPGTAGALHQYVLDAPEARCNDGSPAVMYVRPGTGADARRWVVHLQGGGACATYEDCATRWCGYSRDEAGRVVRGYYDGSKMSSAWGWGTPGQLPALVDASGIHSSDARNPFRDWTQVYFYYCSSDAWSGQGVATYVSEDGASSFTVERRGHQILEAGLAALRAGITTADGTRLSSLTDAELVLFNGTSAGSVGARTNADWVSEQLAPVPVLAAFDAAIDPNDDVLPADGVALREEAMRFGWARRLAAESVAPFVDESCAAREGPRDELFRCGSAVYFTYDHITTPFFVRQDVIDPNPLDTYLALGLTVAQYEGLHRASLQTFATLPEDAVEGPAMTRPPSVFGPRCGQHVGFESTRVFLGDAIETPMGRVSAAAALHAWVDGADGHLIDGVGALSSTCDAP